MKKKDEVGKGNICLTIVTAVLQHLDVEGKVQTEEFNLIKAAALMTHKIKR